MTAGLSGQPWRDKPSLDLYTLIVINPGKIFRHLLGHWVLASQFISSIPFICPAYGGNWENNQPQHADISGRALKNKDRNSI